MSFPVDAHVPAIYEMLGGKASTMLVGVYRLHASVIPGFSRGLSSSCVGVDISLKCE